ncbi:uncharacterized protein LOC129601071 [Paramacrobiotus metropolitanus]|uniref:uncharacterized protein LOC129601071 n=1 Tax=Paramacrobiotus metropolitanus TaxID=2943436 RepID=UPI0024460863|nr:uncharacterized protein LOC129601071 [Paramacrobiotus metropolitanus]
MVTFKECAQCDILNSKWAYMEILFQSIVVLTYSSELSHFLLRVAFPWLRETRADIRTELPHWIRLMNLTSDDACYWVNILRQKLPTNTTGGQYTVCIDHSDSISNQPQSSYGWLRVFEVTVAIFAFFVLSLLVSIICSLIANYRHWMQPLLSPYDKKFSTLYKRYYRTDKPSRLQMLLVVAAFIVLITATGVIVLCVPIAILGIAAYLGHSVSGDWGTIPASIVTLIVCIVYCNLCLLRFRPYSLIQGLAIFIKNRIVQDFIILKKCDACPTSLSVAIGGQEYHRKRRKQSATRIGCLLLLLVISGTVLFLEYPEFYTAMNVLFPVATPSLPDDGAKMLSINRARLSYWVDPHTMYTKPKFLSFFPNGVECISHAEEIVGKTGLYISAAFFAMIPVALVIIIFIICPGIILFMLYAAVRSMCVSPRPDGTKERPILDGLTEFDEWRDRCKIACMLAIYIAWMVTLDRLVALVASEKVFLLMYLMWMFVLIGVAVWEVISLLRKGQEHATGDPTVPSTEPDKPEEDVTSYCRCYELTQPASEKVHVTIHDGLLPCDFCEADCSTMKSCELRKFTIRPKKRSDAIVLNQFGMPLLSSP